MKTFSDNTWGAIFMVLAMLGFVLNDTMMKLSSDNVGLFQAVFIRGCLMTCFVALIARRQRVSINPLAHTDKMLLLRILAEVGLTFCLLTALFNMPIGNVTAIAQTAPLLITLAAALFLGEKVGWQRYVAIGVGFLGVLLVVQPGGENFNIYSLFALGAVVMVTLRDLSTRKVAKTVPSIFITYATILTITSLAGLAALLTQSWVALPSKTLWYLSSAALFLFVGYFFAIKTMRIGDVAYTAAFRYTILLWAMIVGLIVFGEVPDGLTLIGCVVIVLTGLYTLYRERRVARHSS